MNIHSRTRAKCLLIFYSVKIYAQSNMDVEKLIESVKKRTILYQSTRKHYKDVSKKDDAWKEVAEEVGEEVTGY